MISEQTTVNFLDLKAQYLSIKEEVQQAIHDVFEKASFAGGPFVEKFESEFAQAHQAEYCVAVNNGTSALHVMMMALEIGAGDEVIVPANTFFASAEAVSLVGAKPVFVDCDPQSYNIDVSKIESAISSNTKAILAVHLYGQPAPMDAIQKVAQKHQLLVLEDCAQAHLAKYQGKFVGTIGTAGSFSFYPGKNLGAYGEAGAVLTNDRNLYLKMQKIKDHGSAKKYYHDMVGHNFRMSAIQAAVLSVKLRYLPDWTLTRRNAAAAYRSQLAGLENIILPTESDDSYHVYHLFVVQVSDRDSFMQYLRDKGIHCGIHYPIPCHLQKAYEGLGYAVGAFPHAEHLADRVVSLPMSEQLDEEQIRYVTDTVKEFLTTRNLQQL